MVALQVLKTRALRLSCSKENTIKPRDLLVLQSAR
jgi:hypothetical protein